MNRKTARNLDFTAICGLAIGVTSIVCGIAVGTLSIINSAKIMSVKKELKK